MAPAAASSSETIFKVAGHNVDLTPVELPHDHSIVHAMPQQFQDYERKRATGEGMDATLVIGDEKIACHKDLLSARVPFFAGLFNCDMVEATSGVINVVEFDFDTMKPMMDYVYTGKITISDDNVQDIMMVANFLGIEPVMDECAVFIRRRLRIGNALALYDMTKSMGYEKIDQFVIKFIEKNFVPISLTPEFSSLTCDALVAILERDTIYVCDEQQVFDIVNRWMSTDAAKMQYGARLLRCLRFERISRPFVETVIERTPWVVGNSECVAVLEEEKTAHKTRLARECQEAHSLIFPVGGMMTEPKVTGSTMSFYDPIRNEWRQCKSLPKVRGRNGVAVVGKVIYAIGGNDGKDRLNTVDSYDTEKDEWSQELSMNHVRSAMGTGVIDGKIYVAGGFDGNQSHSSVEMFDPAAANPEWKMLEPMLKMRGAPASCVLNGKLYVIGGHTTTAVLRDGECYDPETGKWTAIESMKYARCRFGVAVIDGYIYAAGGFNGCEFLKDVERYDPKMNKWTTLKQMKYRRARATLAVSCGKLFVMGGFDGLNNISLVEMYVPEQDTWVPREGMKAHAGGVFVGTVHIPPTYPSPVANLEIGDIDDIDSLKI